MPRLIDLLGLVEQKKNLYSPGMTVQELAWTEEEQHYFWLHYKLEGEMDTAPWTIEALLQAVRNHEAMRAEPIARYKKYLAEYEGDLNDLDDPGPPFDVDHPFEIEWEEGNSW